MAEVAGHLALVHVVHQRVRHQVVVQLGRVVLVARRRAGTAVAGHAEALGRAVDHPITPDVNRAGRVLIIAARGADNRGRTDLYVLVRRGDGRWSAPRNLGREVNSTDAEFAPQLKAGRAKRNRPDGYAILEASRDALAMPDIIDLGTPAEMLLCTDGYYRAVDHYALHDDAGLMTASAADVAGVLSRLRQEESSDPQCLRFPRFKPADDATAVMLGR
jgi:hypothetical protein